MPRVKQKLCFGCNQPFTARTGAKTCSPRCRKRIQRARAMYQEVLVTGNPKRVKVYAEAAGLRRVYARR